MLDYDIREMYEEMELRLIKSMKRNLQLHLDEEDETGFKYPQWQAMKLKELKRYQRQNKDIVGHDTKGFSSSISKYLKNELREGSYNALKDYRDAMGDKYKANKVLSNSFFKINDKKVNTLINSVNNDLKTANRAVLRMTNDQYRKVIFQSQFYVANGVMTPKQAIDAANKDFLRRGLNVIEYKDGKRVNIASYSQMAVRTAGQRAMLMGEGAFRKKMKQHLIRISSHGTSCELCIPWQGKVLIDDVYSGGSRKDGKYPLVSEAMDQGLFHPNCRHGISTYFGGDDDISDIDVSYANGKDGSESDAAYQDDMNYINRKIKEYQRLEVGSLDETNVKTYRNKRKQWEKKKAELEQPEKLNTLEKQANYIKSRADELYGLDVKELQLKLNERNNFNDKPIVLDANKFDLLEENMELNYNTLENLKDGKYIKVYRGWGSRKYYEKYMYGENSYGTAGYVDGVGTYATDNEWAASQFAKEDDDRLMEIAIPESANIINKSDLLDLHYRIYDDFNKNRDKYIDKYGKKTVEILDVMNENISSTAVLNNIDIINNSEYRNWVILNRKIIRIKKK